MPLGNSRKTSHIIQGEGGGGGGGGGGEVEDKEFPGVLKKEHVEIPGDQLKEVPYKLVEFLGVKACFL